MKNFFNKIFSKSDKVNKKTPLEILAYAISDAGLWTWWAEKFPNTLQLEFNGTMLYFQPKSTNQPPPNQIALQFKEPKSVTVIRKKECSLSDNWLDDFHADKLEPFGINYEYFSFSTKEIKDIIEQADESKTIFGAKLNENELSNYNVRLGFWAGEVGLVVLADAMKIMSHDGEIQLNQIPEKHDKWWEYWRQYWAVIDTDKKMPYDPICEITIPATKENVDKMIEKLKEE
ncbi:hypothetical protein [Maribellus maritimus]|uniref:hypothetical protein n=1 Tax=Maribellus maritimus TaxID=2870838 RepID=UPI001EECBE79|nr:hypothetical protein [Maribellus maritimus]MCG6191537.1 hypothetical protein [Maribellus maritimus]